MKRWVAECDTNHTNCKLGQPLLPTRVLDVENSQNIRLCETGGRPGAYIALSHCWGLSDKTFITTHDTIENMKAGFAIEQAPATFRDANFITRLFGFRYLWIDSLCIIQHDVVDWRREAARMGSVYAKAHLTVAAASAKDDNDGFLQRRIHAMTSLRITSSKGKSTQLYLQTKDDGIKQRRDNTEEPLDARGWALQEQRLSRRSLRFGSTEMSWDCQACSLHEAGPIYSDAPRTPMELLKPYSTVSGPCSYSSWYEVVTLFTERLLTYDTDKLPALWGLATEVARFQRGRYYAGLWGEDMASGMLWFRGHIAELKKPSQYLAPSWSWASLNGRTIIYEDQAPKITLTDVVFGECCLECATGNRYGTIKSGWLDLSAPVVKLVQQEAPARWGVEGEGLDMALGFARLDVPNIEMNDHRDEFDQLRFRRSTKGNFETRGIFDLAHKDGTEIFGLLLAFSHNGAESSEENGSRRRRRSAQEDLSCCSSLYGILVEYSKKRLAYKRVGYFRAMRLEDGEALQILEGTEVQDIRLY